MRLLLIAALIAILVTLAWWVGVHTDDPPTHPHSLGFAARVCIRTQQSERCGQALGMRANLGRNLPIPLGCPHCVTAMDLMQYEPGAGLRVDMVVKVHPRVPFPYLDTQCGEATVDMVISGTEGFWAQHPRLGPANRPPGEPPGTESPFKVVTELALGWDPFTRLTRPEAPPLQTQRGAPALVALFTDPQAPLHPALYTDGDLEGADKPTAVPYPVAAPQGLRIRLSNWADPGSLDQGPVHLHFAANWLASRGWGSCYVVLPSLLANGAFAATQNALAALLQRKVGSLSDVPLEAEAQPPSYGRIALAAAGSLSLGDTSPAPTDYEAIAVDTQGSLQHRINEFTSAGTGKLGPVWACTPSDNLTFLNAQAPRNIPDTGSFAGDACGVVAVVDAPAASDIRATVLIVLGVFIAIAFERLFHRPSEKKDVGKKTGGSSPERSKGEVS